MKVKRTLTALLKVIVEEASHNEPFRTKLEESLNLLDAPKAKSTKAPASEDERRGGRRPPAVLDPIELARQSEESLRQRLWELDVERLLDIVAEFGMDPGKLVMKWKDKERIIDRIVEISISRSTKGDAFRRD
jgi:hypothetical protein